MTTSTIYALADRQRLYSLLTACMERTMRARRQLSIAALLIGTIACGATALLVFASGRTKERAFSAAQLSTKRQVGPIPRNLSLQPEAFKLARRLGGRFSSGTTTASVVLGTLTTGSETRSMQMRRTQTADGESVEIAIAGSNLLTWDATQGTTVSGQQSARTERELIERLVLDSPDQFVLMQLRGASYYTVATGARPAEATDGYSGPLWTIVRVDDPEQDERKRALSPWRLYYLNAATGLIDRIEYEVEGQRVIAQISSWAEQNGEKVPAEIVWTRAGQTLMQYSLTSFTVSEN